MELGVDARNEAHVETGERLVDSMDGAADVIGDLVHVLAGVIAPAHELGFASLQLADAGPESLDTIGGFPTGIR